MRSRGHGARSRHASGVAAASIPGARRAPLPSSPPPAELATLVSTVPDGEGWLHEMKFDGYRMLTRIAKGRARVVSRNGQDWTDRFAALAAAMSTWPVLEAILDGEVVVFDASGISDFQRLQNALSAGAGETLIYEVFDLLYLDGYDLTACPLEARKAALRALVASVAGEKGARIRYSDHVAGEGRELYRRACRLGLEGIVSKRRDAPYRSGRQRDWLKTKCLRGQEFVIGGFTDPCGSREGLGSLLLGYHAEGMLLYAGRVGTGFTQRSLNELRARLTRLERGSTPFANPPRDRAIHWVQPTLVAQVDFLNWTRDGILRHPSFRGLRDDKRASAVVRESASADGSSKEPRVRRAASIAGRPRRPRSTSSKRPAAARKPRRS